MYTIEVYQQMHTSILKLVYMHVDLLHVLANHVAIFMEGKYGEYT